MLKARDIGLYKNKKVLITGHTGFKGSWLSIWLIKLGAIVTGYALDPLTPKDNFVLSNISDKITDIRGDVRDFKKLNSAIEDSNSEIIFHLAAQPLVKQSYDVPLETIETNVLGTANVLESFRLSKAAKILIVITSDKCYENMEEERYFYKETDPMGGYDPYSASKGAAEVISSAYLRSFFNPESYENHGKTLATVRAGNVIGGGDNAKNRLVPDSIKAIEQNKPIEIRNPDSVRPWQHVLEPLYGYLLLASKIQDNPRKYCGAWNFGPYNDGAVTVKEIAEKIIKYYGKGRLTYSNRIINGTDERTKDDNNNNLNSHSSRQHHEAKLLNLDINKAISVLGWKPTFNIDEAVRLTVNYHKRLPTESAFDVCKNQIELYEVLADKKVNLINSK